MKKLQKQIAKLMEKNQGNCSICKRTFDDESVVYTCTGYDKIRRLQVTSYCCNEKIVNVVNIGVMGYFNPDDFEELMSNHPLANAFKNKRKIITGTDIDEPLIQHA